MLLFAFSHHNVDMACALMESCGRFLYRSPDSHQRTKIYLEQMMRKKVALSMDGRYVVMIENAFYAVNPPETTAVEIVKEPPMHLYVQKLIFADLGKSTTEKVLKQVRKLDWNDDVVSAYAVRCLGAVWYVKYYNVKYVASLLAALVATYDWIGPQIVDGVLEDVRLMMEVNDAKFNQRRIATVKFLGELYNYRMVDSSVVFKVLYSLISFGAASKPDDPAALALDPPDHMLRLRLVAVLLDTCGSYFNSGANKKLDYFIVYFQRYYWRKRASIIWTVDEPADEEADEEEDSSKKKGKNKKKSKQQQQLNTAFPIAMINLVAETLVSLRPKIKMCKSLEQAEEAAKKIDAEMLKTLEEKAPSLAQYLRQDASAGNSESGAGLGAIAEEGEEDEVVNEEEDSELEEDDEDPDEEDMDEGAKLSGPSRSASAMAGYESHDDLSQRDEFSQGTTGSGSAAGVQMDVEFTTTAPKLIACEEDDEFKNAFDRMLNENIAESRNTALPKGQQISIVAPINRGKQQQHQQPKLFSTFNGDSQRQAAGAGVVQFALLVKGKGSKPGYRDLSVPADSDLAKNLQRQEAADRLEKERVKKLTLEISERQEKEDLNEAIAQMQRPMASMGGHYAAPRRDAGYQPPRGAPDADAIFGRSRPVNQ